MDGMHACWLQGVGGMGYWRIEKKMKRFDSTKPRYSHLFKYGTLLTNFLHKRKMDFTYEVISDHLLNP
jgi:hypothetical protein